MYCEEARRKLNAYLDGELAPERSAFISEHLQACAQCAEELGRLRSLNRLLDAVPGLTAPEGLARAVRERTTRDAPERMVVLAERRAARRLVRVAAMLALAVGVLAGAWMGHSVSQVKADQLTASVLESGNAFPTDMLNGTLPASATEDYLGQAVESE